MTKHFKMKSFLVALAASAAFVAPANADDPLFELSLEELLTLEVTSVAKKPQSPDEAAAAITVLTSEDLRKAGVTNLTEALRMAPGVEVAEIDGNITAVSIRAFNWRFSNKLLVLIDGRAVYQPSISGIFWDQQMVPVEDIQRIEIVRGPGATMWGANAMNGVINIVTKHSADTLKGQATVEAGSDDRYRAFGRYGFKMGDVGAGRVYAVARKTPSLVEANGENYNDGGETLAVGFRTDFEPLSGRDSITVQGEIQDLTSEYTISTSYSGGSVVSQTNLYDGSGYFLLGRWVRSFSSDHAFTLQAYVDHIDRQEFGSHFVVTTQDIDFSHNFRPNDWMDVVWGLNARRMDDTLESDFGFNFSPSKSSAEWTSGFIQGEFEPIDDRLRITLGSKFEDNSFTGFESQPSLRAIWLGESDWALWGAASRAVRTPSRIETSLDTTINRIPAFSTLNPGPLDVNVSIRGSEDFDVEVLQAYEMGFRKSWSDTASLDVTIFQHDYEDLLETYREDPALVFAPVGPMGMMVPVSIDQTLRLQNGDAGTLRGVELAYSHQLADWWSIDVAGNVMDLDLVPPVDGQDQSGALEFNGDAPVWQASIRSDFTLRDNLDASVWLRHVSEFDNEALASYTDLDLRLTWQVNDRFELSVIGENLLEPRRMEATSSIYPTPDNFVERRALVRAGFRF